MKETSPAMLHSEDGIRKISQELLALAERLEAISRRLEALVNDAEDSESGEIFAMEVHDHIYEVDDLAAKL